MVRKEFGALTKPAAAAPDRTYAVPLQTELLVKMATDPEATQSSVSLINKRPRTAGRDRRRVSPQPGAPARVPDAQRAIRRAVAQARRAVPRRRRLRERPEPDDVDRGARRERSGREDSGGPDVGRRRGEARRAARLRGRRARSREEAHRGVVRPRLCRAREDRERRLRPGVREPLPRERAQPRHRLRAQAGAGAAARHHRRRRHGGGQAAVRQPEPRHPRHVATEERPHRTDRSGTARCGRQRREGRGHGVGGHLIDGGAARQRSRAGGDQGSAPAPRARRHRRALRQRGRGVVQVDRFQERRSAVLAGVAGRIVARAARAVRRGLAVAGTGPAVGIGRTQGRRPAAAARRQDRLGLADHVLVFARHLGKQQPGKRRNRAAAALSSSSPRRETTPTRSR